VTTPETGDCAKDDTQRARAAVLVAILKAREWRLTRIDCRLDEAAG
jgi:hypothetical protein